MLIRDPLVQALLFGMTYIISRGVLERAQLTSAHISLARARRKGGVQRGGGDACEVSQEMDDPTESRSNRAWIESQRYPREGKDVATGGKGGQDGTWMEVVEGWSCHWL